MNRRAFLASTAGLATIPTSRATPRELGFDPAKLETVRATLAQRNSTGFLVMRHGQVALEWYGPKFDAHTKHFTASMAKALVGGVSLLIATADGRIRPNDLASKFIPEWRTDPRRSKITIRHLATHTSGIEDSTSEGVVHNEEPGWKGRFWRREPDPFSVSLQEAPVLFEPGAGNQYSNPGMAVLAYCVTASLRGAPQSNIRSLLQDRVMRPLQVPDDEWSIGYGKAYPLNGLDLYANWGGASYSARATAKVAEWLMQGGRKLVPKRFVDQALKYAGMPIPDRTVDLYAPGSGLAFYTNFDNVWPTVPRDAFAGAGAGHQVFLAIPSLELILVRHGAELIQKGEKEAYWTAIYRHLFEPVMAALDYPVKPAAAPYPPSKVFRGVSFAPPSTIVRKAIDSDNWPITWADDDNLYTAYGDGFGFEPPINEKLSLGFAKVTGDVAGCQGINLRSPSGEAKGDGARGAKASGLLMVDGVLYLWIRNVYNSQLLWSRDHGQTWEKGFKVDTGFGSPTFLNFGRNYAGAPDEYVYAYSQSGPSAYNVDDSIVMARAPKSRIQEKSAWEFRPEPVFRFPQHCQRVDAVYHAATKRYLLLVGYGHDGGWGIYDAPNPWGPWTTVFHTEYWGLGETHGYRLPSKWIAPDGRSAALVFSGLIYNGISYDAFCIRRMNFDLA